MFALSAEVYGYIISLSSSPQASPAGELGGKGAREQRKAWVGLESFKDIKNKNILVWPWK
jgi:hypothetical protein